jgi:RHS repeat-associated protein
VVQVITDDGTAQQTVNYQYGPDGIRTQKDAGGTTTQFTIDYNRDYAQVLRETTATDTVTYTYGDDLLSQERSTTTTPSFFLYDGLGSTRALADSTGNLTDSYDYVAFGEMLNESGLNESGTTENSYRYTGEQFDQSLDQYYLRARYYNQGVGRFTQMDTWMGSSQDPITLHKYVYADNTPVNLLDYSGYCSTPAKFGYAVEDQVEPQYVEDHPKDLVQFGGRTGLGLNPRLKPDIQNFSQRLFNEIKPLSLSGVAKGLVQMRIYNWSLKGEGFESDPDWLPRSPTIVCGEETFFFNVDGLIFYTTSKSLAEQAAIGAVTIAALRQAIRISKPTNKLVPVTTRVLGIASRGVSLGGRVMASNIRMATSSASLVRFF